MAGWMLHLLKNIMMTLIIQNQRLHINKSQVTKQQTWRKRQILLTHMIQTYKNAETLYTCSKDILLGVASIQGWMIPIKVGNVGFGCHGISHSKTQRTLYTSSTDISLGITTYLVFCGIMQFWVWLQQRTWQKHRILLIHVNVSK